MSPTHGQLVKTRVYLFFYASPCPYFSFFWKWQQTVANSMNSQETPTKLIRRLAYLPDRLLLVVFSFLGPREICNSMRVCQRWKKIGKNYSLANDLHLNAVYSG